ncbi:polyprotein [Picornavirales Bu-3]|uniref:polyprotein n=1 Tax=Picornavirales Bu-3 TaxID=1813613 RepID=UPI0008110C2F|nr:polyprotein [Picornavirales Bu-3]BAV31557.1 polyprotein [Picornavirales Bu-3]
MKRDNNDVNHEEEEEEMKVKRFEDGDKNAVKKSEGASNSVDGSTNVDEIDDRMNRDSVKFTSSELAGFGKSLVNRVGLLKATCEYDEFVQSEQFINYEEEIEDMQNGMTVAGFALSDYSAEFYSNAIDIALALDQEVTRVPFGIPEGPMESVNSVESRTVPAGDSMRNPLDLSCGVSHGLDMLYLAQRVFNMWNHRVPAAPGSAFEVVRYRVLLAALVASAAGESWDQERMNLADYLRKLDSEGWYANTPILGKKDVKILNKLCKHLESSRDITTESSIKSVARMMASASELPRERIDLGVPTFVISDWVKCCSDADVMKYCYHNAFYASCMLMIRVNSAIRLFLNGSALVGLQSAAENSNPLFSRQISLLRDKVEDSYESEVAIASLLMPEAMNRYEKLVDGPVKYVADILEIECESDFFQGIVSVCKSCLSELWGSGSSAIVWVWSGVKKMVTSFCGLLSAAGGLLSSVMSALEEIFTSFVDPKQLLAYGAGWGAVSSLLCKFGIFSVSNVAKDCAGMLVALVAVVLIGCLGLLSVKATMSVLRHLRSSIAVVDAEGYGMSEILVLIIPLVAYCLDMPLSKTREVFSTFSTFVVAGLNGSKMLNALLTILPSALRRCILLRFGTESDVAGVMSMDLVVEGQTLLALAKKNGLVQDEKFLKKASQVLLDMENYFCSTYGTGAPANPALGRTYTDLCRVVGALLTTRVGIPSRVYPFWVHFYGEPGVGKSVTLATLLDQFLPTVQDVEGKRLSKSDVYYRANNDPYYSGFQGREKVLVWDEFLNTSDEVLKKQSMMDMLTLVSCTPWLPPLPAIEPGPSGMKGTEMRVEVVLTLNNCMGFAEGDESLLTGLKRRRAFVVKVQPAEKYAAKFSQENHSWDLTGIPEADKKDAKYLDFVIQNSFGNGQGGGRIAQLNGLTKLREYMLAEWKKHRAMVKQLLAGVHLTYDFDREFERAKKVLSGFIKETEEEDNEAQGDGDAEMASASSDEQVEEEMPEEEKNVDDRVAVYRRKITSEEIDNLIRNRLKWDKNSPRKKGFSYWTLVNELTEWAMRDDVDVQVETVKQHLNQILTEPQFVKVEDANWKCGPSNVAVDLWRCMWPTGNPWKDSRYITLLPALGGGRVGWISDMIGHLPKCFVFSSNLVDVMKIRLCDLAQVEADEIEVHKANGVYFAALHDAGGEFVGALPKAFNWVAAQIRCHFDKDGQWYVIALVTALAKAQIEKSKNYAIVIKDLVAKQTSGTMKLRSVGKAARIDWASEQCEACAFTINGKKVAEPYPVGETCNPYTAELVVSQWELFKDKVRVKETEDMQKAVDTLSVRGHADTVSVFSGYAQLLCMMPTKFVFDCLADNSVIDCYADLRKAQREGVYCQHWMDWWKKVREEKAYCVEHVANVNRLLVSRFGILPNASPWPMDVSWMYDESSLEPKVFKNGVMLVNPRFGPDFKPGDAVGSAFGFPEEETDGVSIDADFYSETLPFVQSPVAVALKSVVQGGLVAWAICRAVMMIREYLCPGEETVDEVMEDITGESGWDLSSDSEGPKKHAVPKFSIIVGGEKKPCGAVCEERVPVFACLYIGSSCECGFLCNGRKFISHDHITGAVLSRMTEQSVCRCKLVAGDETYAVSISRGDVRRCIERDLCCIDLSDNKNVPEAPNIRGVIMSNEEMLATETWRRPVVVEAVLHGVNYSAEAKFLKSIEYRLPAGARKRLDSVWSYPMNSEAGDCGSIIWIQGKNGPKILGVHVAGSMMAGVKRGYCTPLYGSLFEELVGEMPVSEGRMVDIEKALGPNLEYYGEVPKEERVFLPDTIKHQPSPMQKLDVIPVEYEPAILSRNDVRNINRVDPVVNGLAALSHCEQASVDEKVVDAVAADWLELMKPRFDFSGHPGRMTLEEAVKGVPGLLNSVNLNSSAGFPLCLLKRGKGKRAFTQIVADDGSVVVDPEFRQLVGSWVSYFEGVAPKPHEVVYLAYLKNETVKLSKVADVRTRLIYASPYARLVACRILFGNLLMAANNAHGEFGIGINQYSKDMERFVFGWLTENGLPRPDSFVAGDYKAFDQHYQRVFQLKAYELLFSLIPKENDVSHEMWDRFVRDEVDGIIQVGNVRVHPKVAHLSGCMFTTVVNCIVNSLYIRYLFSLRYPAKRYDDLVRGIFLGDDHVLCVMRDRVDFDGVMIQEDMKKLNQVYTSDNKDEPMVAYRKFDEISFLGSVPRLYDGIWAGAPKKVTIEQCLLWMKDMESYVQTAHSMVEYSIMWGQEYAHWLYELVRRSSPEDFTDLVEPGAGTLRRVINRSADSGEWDPPRYQGEDVHKMRADAPEYYPPGYNQGSATKRDQPYTPDAPGTTVMPSTVKSEPEKAGSKGAKRRSRKGSGKKKARKGIKFQKRSAGGKPKKGMKGANVRVRIPVEKQNLVGGAIQSSTGTQFVRDTIRHIERRSRNPNLKLDDETKANIQTVTTLLKALSFLDAPLEVGPPAKFMPFFQQQSAVDGPVQGVSLQMNPGAGSHLARAMVNPEELNLDFFFSRDSLYNTVNWRKEDGPREFLWFGEFSSAFNCWSENSSFTSCPQSCAVGAVNQFCTWRADLVLTFQVVKTPFHTGRLRLVMGYDCFDAADLAKYGMTSWNTVLDFTGDQDTVVVRVPFMGSLDMLYTYDGPRKLAANSNIPRRMFSLGYFGLQVLNPLSVASNAVPTTVRILTFIHLDNVRVGELKPQPIWVLRDSELTTRAKVGKAAATTEKEGGAATTVTEKEGEIVAEGDVSVFTTDEAPDEWEQVDVSMAPTGALADSGDHMNVGVESFLFKDSFQWTTTQQYGDVIAQYSLPIELLEKSASDSQAVAMRSNTYWRSDLEVRVQTNGNNFQCGRLIASWYPLEPDNYEPSVELSANVQHAFVEPYNSGDLVLHIPFIHWYSSLRTYARGRDNNLGKLRFYVLAPLSYVNGSPVTVSLFLRFVDPVFQIPRPLTDVVAEGDPEGEQMLAVASTPLSSDTEDDPSDDEGEDEREQMNPKIEVGAITEFKPRTVLEVMRRGVMKVFKWPGLNASVNYIRAYINPIGSLGYFDAWYACAAGGKVVSIMTSSRPTGKVTYCPTFGQTSTDLINTLPGYGIRVGDYSYYRDGKPLAWPVAHEELMAVGSNGVGVYHIPYSAPLPFCPKEYYPGCGEVFIRVSNTTAREYLDDVLITERAADDYTPLVFLPPSGGITFSHGANVDFATASDVKSANGIYA